MRLPTYKNKLVCIEYRREFYSIFRNVTVSVNHWWFIDFIADATLCDKLHFIRLECTVKYVKVHTKSGVNVTHVLSH